MPDRSPLHQEAHAELATSRDSGPDHAVAAAIRAVASAILYVGLRIVDAIDESKES